MSRWLLARPLPLVDSGAGCRSAARAVAGIWGTPGRLGSCATTVALPGVRPKTRGAGCPMQATGGQQGWTRSSGQVCEAGGRRLTRQVLAQCRWVPSGRVGIHPGLPSAPPPSSATGPPPVPGPAGGESVRGGCISRGPWPCCVLPRPRLPRHFLHQPCPLGGRQQVPLCRARAPQGLGTSRCCPGLCPGRQLQAWPREDAPYGFVDRPNALGALCLGGSAAFSRLCGPQSIGRRSQRLPQPTSGSRPTCLSSALDMLSPSSLPPHRPTLPVVK